MLNSNNYETPELGDYSKEELVLREQSQEIEPLDEISNHWEANAKKDPILALKEFLKEAKAVLAKLV
jgi:hypothetical protein